MPRRGGEGFAVEIDFVLIAIRRRHDGRSRQSGCVFTCGLEANDDGVVRILSDLRDRCTKRGVQWSIARRAGTR